MNYSHALDKKGLAPEDCFGTDVGKASAADMCTERDERMRIPEGWERSEFLGWKYIGWHVSSADLSYPVKKTIERLKKEYGFSAMDDRSTAGFIKRYAAADADAYFDGCVEEDENLIIIGRTGAGFFMGYPENSAFEFDHGLLRAYMDDRLFGECMEKMCGITPEKIMSGEISPGKLGKMAVANAELVYKAGGPRLRNAVKISENLMREYVNCYDFIDRCRNPPDDVLQGIKTATVKAGLFRRPSPDTIGR